MLENKAKISFMKRLRTRQRELKLSHTFQPLLLQTVINLFGFNMT